MIQHLTALQAVLTVLAVARLAILVTNDTITEPARDWLDRRYTGKLIDFVHCPWCVSVWIAGGAVPLTMWCWWWWSWVALGLSGSLVAGLVGEVV